MAQATALHRHQSATEHRFRRLPVATGTYAVTAGEIH